MIAGICFAFVVLHDLAREGVDVAAMEDEVDVVAAVLGAAKAVKCVNVCILAVRVQCPEEC